MYSLRLIQKNTSYVIVSHLNIAGCILFTFYDSTEPVAVAVLANGGKQQQRGVFYAGSLPLPLFTPSKDSDD